MLNPAVLLWRSISDWWLDERTVSLVNYLTLYVQDWFSSDHFFSWIHLFYPHFHFILFIHSAATETRFLSEFFILCEHKVSLELCCSLTSVEETVLFFFTLIKYKEMWSLPKDENYKLHRCRFYLFSCFNCKCYALMMCIYLWKVWLFIFISCGCMQLTLKSFFSAIYWIS